MSESQYANDLIRTLPVISVLIYLLIFNRNFFPNGKKDTDYIYFSKIFIIVSAMCLLHLFQKAEYFNPLEHRLLFSYIMFGFLSFMYVNLLYIFSIPFYFYFKMKKKRFVLINNWFISLANLIYLFSAIGLIFWE